MSQSDLISALKVSHCCCAWGEHDFMLLAVIHLQRYSFTTLRGFANINVAVSMSCCCPCLRHCHCGHCCSHCCSHCCCHCCSHCCLLLMLHLCFRFKMSPYPAYFVLPAVTCPQTELVEYNTVCRFCAAYQNMQHGQRTSSTHPQFVYACFMRVGLLAG